MPECERCDRTVTKTTRHRLAPNEREERPTVDRCHPGHDQVHAVVTHHELKQDDDTLEKPRSAPELETFVTWGWETDPGHVKTRDAERVREWCS